MNEIKNIFQLNQLLYDALSYIQRPVAISGRVHFENLLLAIKQKKKE